MSFCWPGCLCIWVDRRCSLHGHALQSLGDLFPGRNGRGVRRPCRKPRLPQAIRAQDANGKKCLGVLLTTENTDRHGTNSNRRKNLARFRLRVGCIIDEPPRIQPERNLHHFPCPSVLSVVENSSVGRAPSLCSKRASSPWPRQPGRVGIRDREKRSGDNNLVSFSHSALEPFSAASPHGERPRVEEPGTSGLRDRAKSGKMAN